MITLYKTERIEKKMARDRELFRIYR